MRLLNTARDKMAVVGQPPPQKFLTELPFRYPLPLATQSQKIRRFRELQTLFQTLVDGHIVTHPQVTYFDLE